MKIWLIKILLYQTNLFSHFKIFFLTSKQNILRINNLFFLFFSVIKVEWLFFSFAFIEIRIFVIWNFFHNYCITAEWFLSNFEEISVLKLNFESITFFVINVIFNYKWQHQEFNSYFLSWQSSLIIMSFENWNSNLFCRQCLGMKKLILCFLLKTPSIPNTWMEKNINWVLQILQVVGWIIYCCSVFL